MFKDRHEAGQRLAERLAERRLPNPVVFALPRGGVPVAAAVARRIGAPLGLVHVRKIGVPHDPELAVAAIAAGEKPHLAVNREIADMYAVDDGYLRTAAEHELKEIDRRRMLYEGGRPGPSARGASAILVDDGIATGATIEASVMALRAAGPARIIVAIPVAPASALAKLAEVADEVVCLESPDDFHAVGQFYRDFRQVTDKEVVALIHALRLEAGIASLAPPPASHS